MNYGIGKDTKPRITVETRSCQQKDRHGFQQLKKWVDRQSEDPDLKSLYPLLDEFQQHGCRFTLILHPPDDTQKEEEAVILERRSKHSDSTYFPHHLSRLPDESLAVFLKRVFQQALGAARTCTNQRINRLATKIVPRGIAPTDGCSMRTHADTFAGTRLRRTI